MMNNRNKKVTQSTVVRMFKWNSLNNKCRAIQYILIIEMYNNNNNWLS